jgi:tRNA threonylcarbamoyladenosine biosynthesis protein TsaE
MTNEGANYSTISAKETIELGEKIGKKLAPNDIIALSGQLGAGKTTLIQGIAKGLKIEENITSPTFIIINEHQGTLPLFHFDLYRINALDEIENLGVEEYFNKGGICVIEWAEKLATLMPKCAHIIKITLTGENEREICVSLDLAARINA